MKNIQLSRTVSFLVTSIAALAAVPVFAAPISWNAPQVISGDSDVSLTGSLDRAHLFGGASANVNGVFFTPFGGGDTTSFGAQYGSFGGGGAPFDNLSLDYRTVLTNGFYGGAGSETITLNNLASGLDYEAQFWVNDSRDCCSGRNGSISDSGTLAYSSVPGGNGGVGSYVKGTFTADSASQVLTMNSGHSTQVSGLQLRATGVSAGNTATVTAQKNYASLTSGAGSTVNFNYSTDSWQSTVLSGAGSLQKSGAGTLILTSAQTYTGGTTISGGTLQLGTPTSAAAGASLQLDASTLTAGSLTTWNDVSGNGNVLSVGGGSPTVVPNALNGKSVVDLGAYGSGTWMQFGTDMTNIQTGFMVMDAGNFLLGSTYNYHFHRGGANGMNDSDTIWQSTYAAGPLKAGQTYVNGQQVNGENTGTPSGYSMLGFATSGGGVQSNALANDRNIGGRQGGQKIGEIILFNSVLSAADRIKTEAYLAGKWLSAGATNDVLPTSTPVSISGGGKLDLSGFNQTIGSLAASDASGTEVKLGAGRLTIGGANNTSFDGVISGSGGLTRAGNGALTLAGVNTYTGTTDVNSGKLLVSGSLAVGSAVTVASTGTLGGSGTVNGPVTVNAGGAIESASGTLTLASLTLSSTSVFNIATASGGSVNITGTNGLNAGGIATINITGAAPTIGLHSLINYDGALGGGTGSFALGTLPNRVLANLDHSGATLIQLNVTGTDFPIWSGAEGGAWTTTAGVLAKNWVLASAPGTGTDFLAGDNVLFDDSANIANTAVGINGADVVPATVVFNNTANNYTVSGTHGIAGSTSITKSGTGNLTLSTPNSFSGAVNVNAGTVRTGHANAFGSTAIGTTVAASATLDLNGTAVGSEPLTLNGSLVNTSGTAASFAGDITVATAATFGGSGESTLSGVIGGGGVLTKADVGRVILSGASTYSGQIQVNAGALRVANNAGMGAGGFNGVSNSFIANGATLELANSVTLTEHFHFAGTGIGGTGGVRSISGNNTLSTAIAIDSNSSIGVDADTLTVNGVIYHDSGSLSLTKIGNGTLALGAANTFSGGLNINAGIVKPTVGTALGAGTVTVNSGGSLDMNAQTLTGKNIQIAGAGADASLGALGNANAAANLNSIENITLTGNASIGGNGGRWDIGRYDFPGMGINTIHIFGNGHVLTKVGTSYLGLLASAAPGSDLAGTIVDGGTVAPHQSLSFGSGPVTVNTGAIVRPWGAPVFANNFTLNGGTIESEAFTDNYNGTFAIGAGGGNFTGVGATLVNGVVSGTAAINKTGSGTLRLASANTHTGDYNFNGGRINVASASGPAILGNINYTGGGFLIAEQPNQFGPTTIINFASTAGHAEVALFGNNQTIAGLTTINDLTVLQNSHSGVGNATASAVLTINQNFNSSYNGYIRDNTGNDSTKLGIVKSGSGKLALNGGNLTYTGATTINGGTLEVNGPITGSSFTIDNGGTLAGTGSTGPVTVYNGGTIAPGNSPGVLTSGSLIMSSGSILALEINGTTLGTDYDQLSINGTVDITGATLNLSGTYLTAPTIANDLFTILLNDGSSDAVTGTFAGLPDDSYFTAASGQDFIIDYNGGDGNDITLLAVPEPGSAALLLGGLAMLAGRRRRTA